MWKESTSCVGVLKEVILKEVMVHECDVISKISLVFSLIKGPSMLLVVGYSLAHVARGSTCNYVLPHCQPHS